MVYLDLIIKFESENVDKVFITDPQNYNWTFIIECSNCKNQHSKEIYFSNNDEVEKSKVKNFNLRKINLMLTLS